MGARKRIGVGVIGFGWLGHAHSRSLLRIPTLFGGRSYDPVLVACSDPVPDRTEEALASFGFARAHADWKAVIDDPDVQVVYVAAPNMMHVELVQAAAAAGKAVFCEKPVGGTPEQIAAAARAAREAHVTSGVGFNYRWAPLVRYAAELIAGGELGEITNYRGRFFSMYGADPLGVNSWRFKLDQAGYGVTSDLLSHSVDLAHMLLGPIARVSATIETFIRERPEPVGAASHYGRGTADDPLSPVTNEDYVGMLCEFASGTRGTFEASRTIVGPESQNAFDVYGTRGALSWDFERLNELRLYRSTEDRGSGYVTVRGGDRFAHHGTFVPGSGNPIGFEDLITIEDYEFCAAVAEGRPFEPGFEQALAWASVQDALLRSAEQRRLGGGGRDRRRGPGLMAGATTAVAPLRIGVIGVGRIGRMHARVLARQVPGATVGAVYDARPPTAREVADELGVPAAGSVAEMLDGDVDAIAICSTSETHVELLIAAAEAGKAVFCEKPVSLELSELDRALAAIDAAGVPFQIGFNRRFDPAHASVREAVASGAVGELQLVRISSRDPEPPPVEYIRSSGGLFLDMTIHDFDMARFVTGSEVVEVFARGAVRVDQEFARAGDIDTALVTLVHEDGCLTAIDNARRTVYGYDQRVEVFGSGGMAASDNPLVHTGVVRTARGTERPSLPDFFLERYMPSYVREWEAFVRAVQSGATPPVSGADARAPLVIGLAAERSLRERRAVAVAEIEGAPSLPDTATQEVPN